jgi:phosphohistidine phosphatase
MMEIYILRHGAAEDSGPGRPDAERALTADGKEKLRRVLERARAAGAWPSLILTSPYRRAVETAGEAASVLSYDGKLVRCPLLVPEISPFDVWEELRAHATEKAILLASHEPLCSSLVAFLLGSPSLLLEMKKAALVRIDCERLGREPKGVLKWMLTPSVARD